MKANNPLNRPCQTHQNNSLYKNTITAFIGCVVLIFCVPSLFSQAANSGGAVPEEVQQFIAGSIADKTRVLLKIDMTQNLPDRTRRLPRDAIEFVLTHRKELGDTPELENLFLTALGKLQAPQDVELVAGLLNVWSGGRIASAVMTRLYDFAQAQSAHMKGAIPSLNAFLQNTAGSLPQNAEIVHTAIKTLSFCGDSSSFHTLFSLAHQNQDAQTSALAQAALVNIKDGFEQNALLMITEGTMAEKLFMFNLIQAQENFSTEFKAKSAETALSQAISMVRNSNTASADVIDLQTQSLAAIVRYEWTQSSQLVLSLFPIAEREYEAGILSEGLFIQVIQANASLGVSGASRVLSNYLAVLNTITEKGAANPASQKVSAAVALALINTLGTLGDKTAFDNLLYVTYLDYDNAIIQSAREALTKLKW